jgi:hypothetical protein
MEVRQPGSDIPSVTLNNGIRMPQPGFGVFLMPVDTIDYCPNA